jgi:uroporphyrinogen decarboxylase
MFRRKPFSLQPEMQNQLLTDAALGKETSRKPVWLMRQAGRVLPEYREVRAAAGSFLNLVKNPELASEVTIQPVDILGVDAAIIFSDILVLPEAMGLPYELIETRGPVFPNPIRTMGQVEQLRIAREADYQYLLDALSLTRKKLDGRVPLIGFAGAPWTLFAYMIEGKGSKTFSLAKKFLYAEPLLSEKLIDKLSESLLTYLKAQIAAGAQCLQVFDSWAGLLSLDIYKRYFLEPLAVVFRELRKSNPEIPLIFFPKDAHYLIPSLSDFPCHAVSLDWTLEPEEARKNLGSGMVLQGNTDPCLLYADFPVIETGIKRMMEKFGSEKHIVNLGHGLYPDLEKEKVKFFVETVKKLGK